MNLLKNREYLMANNIMSGWREIKLGDLVKNTIDNRGKNAPLDTEGIIPLLESNLLKAGDRYPDLASASKFVNIETYQNWFRSGHPNPKDVLITTVGNIGKVALMPQDKGCIAQNIIAMQYKEDIDSTFMYYCLSQPNIQSYIQALNISSVQPSIKVGHLYSIPVNIPPVEVQRKIAGVLGALDDKIELNNKINQNLELQAQALFKSWFIDKINPNRKTIKAEEFFNITIGKTPPRKEPEWFSKNTNDIKWISISDMGNCGLYISDSSEYLVPESISKFNVKIVPDNTVLLSFKLTVGRIAITDGEMATNEAIAHFGTDKKEINEYLYYYLKNFNFQTMGSTSSIATAVNSKIIKSMPFVMPEESELKDFHSVISPMFAQIKANQRENIQLSALRDTLLPKLMSGKINVDNVEV